MNNVANVRPGVQIHNTTHPTNTDAIVNQSRLWMRHARRFSDLTIVSIYQKAVTSTEFCQKQRTRAFTIPTKLAGTSFQQEALRAVTEINPMYGHKLVTERHCGGVAVTFCDVRLGYVKACHAGWVLPLLDHGLTIHLLQVTGTEREGVTLGCNIAIANVAAAIERLHQAESGGSPAATSLQEDVFLWRDVYDIPHVNIPILVRDSSDHPDWGYTGKAPRRLAASILHRFTDPSTADRLAPEFESTILTNLPHEGGLLRAAFLISWIYAHCA